MIGSSQALDDGSSEPFVGDAYRLGGFFAAESLQSQKAIEVLSQNATWRHAGHRRSFKKSSSLSQWIYWDLEFFGWRLDDRDLRQ